MGAERPNLISARNDVIRIALPYLEDTIETYITVAIAAGGTTLTVKDNSDFANNDYLILGSIGTEQTEIVKIGAAVSAGTSLTIGATTFAHSAGTPVKLIRYNQVALYGHATATSGSPTLIGSAVGLDVQHGFNEIKASTTYAYYYARYYNEQTATYSAYADATIATGLSAQSRGEIKLEFLSIYNEQIDDLITDDWLNRAINRWQRELGKRRKNWASLRATTTATAIQDQQKYSLPTDIQDNDSKEAIISVKFSDDNILQYINQEPFLRVTKDHIGTTLAADVGLADVTLTLTNSRDFASSGSVNVQGDSIAYTGNTVATGTLTGVTGITATHSSGNEVWQSHSTSTPTHYTIDNGYIKLYQMPASADASKNINIEYWKKFVDLSDDADETLFTAPENCYSYLYWQVSIRRRLDLQEQLARRGVWKDELEYLVSEDTDFRDIYIKPTNFYKNAY